MITEDRMRILFAEANPIPDESALVLEEREVIYLTNPDQRSSEVSQQTPRTDQPRRQRGAAWAVATVVAVLAVAALYIGLSGDEDPVAPATPDPGPTSTSTSLPSTTLAEDAAPPELQGVWTADTGAGVFTRLTLGASTYHFGDGTPDAGRISVKGDLIEFFNGSKPGCEVIGPYQWSLEDGILRITALEPLDTCSERRGVMDGWEFTRFR